MDPFIAEIRIFPFRFAPNGWAMCNGQLLPISQNAALFSILGTTYGGDGKSNFALPNLQGSVPLKFGQGPGLSPYSLGQKGGNQTVTLLDSENPSHNHLLVVADTDGSSSDPSGKIFGKGNYVSGTARGQIDLYTETAPAVTLKSTAVGVVGGNLPHNNMMPYLTLNFCIALRGIFPPRPPISGS